MYAENFCGWLNTVKTVEVSPLKCFTVYVCCSFAKLESSVSQKLTTAVHYNNTAIISLVQVSLEHLHIASYLSVSH